MDHRQTRFNEQAQQALASARAEAGRLRHEYIGTEHLVLGLTLQADGAAVVVLDKLNIDVKEVRYSIESIIKRGNALSRAESTLPYTTRTQKTFELAKQSAQELGQSEVGPEHLLVGVLRERMGIGAQVLLDSGLTADAAMGEIQKLSTN